MAGRAWVVSAKSGKLDGGEILKSWRLANVYGLSRLVLEGTKLICDTELVLGCAFSAW